MPARTLDLAVPEYFLWDYIKSKVYGTYRSSTDELKTINSEAYSRDS